MRRLFVGIMSGFLVGSSSIGVATSQYGIDLEKDRLAHDALVVARKNLQSRRVKHALIGGSNAVRTILRAIELPHACERLGRTRYDPGPLHQWYPAQLAYREQPMQKTEWKIDASTPDSTKAPYEEPGFGYGNGFIFGDRNTFVSNNHVAQHITKIATRKYDIDVLRVPEEFAAKDDRQIVRDEPLSPGQDLEGSLVVMTSIDPDSTSDPNGHKTFCGVTFKITSEFIKNVFQISLGNKVGRDLAASYAFVIPLGEGHPDKEGHRPAEGTSGSPVWVFDENDALLQDRGDHGSRGRVHRLRTGSEYRLFLSHIHRTLHPRYAPAARLKFRSPDIA
jgi:hypothetical protein